MTEHQYQLALACWFKAISDYLNDPDKDERRFKSFEDVAKQWSKELNVPFDHLDKVAEWFNWDQVCKDIRP